VADERTGPSDEQLLYARILAVGMYTGLVTLLVTFAVYLSGALAPAVPIEELPHLWTMDVQTYLHAVNEEYVHREHGLTGWWWVGALGSGDFLTFLGIALLACVTPICFAGIVPMLVRRRDWIYTTIAVVEVLILTLAASGVLTAGGH
jgi:hypothetical protein